MNNTNDTKSRSTLILPQEVQTQQFVAQNPATLHTLWYPIVNSPTTTVRERLVTIGRKNHPQHKVSCISCLIGNHPQPKVTLKDIRFYKCFWTFFDHLSGTNTLAQTTFPTFLEDHPIPLPPFGRFSTLWEPFEVPERCLRARASGAACGSLGVVVVVSMPRRFGVLKEAHITHITAKNSLFWVVWRFWMLSFSQLGGFLAKTSKPAFHFLNPICFKVLKALLGALTKTAPATQTAKLDSPEDEQNRRSQ